MGGVLIYKDHDIVSPVWKHTAVQLGRYGISDPIWRYAFDGDNLTITKLSAKDQIKATRKYNARLFLMVSHNDGLLSGNMMPIKDLAIGLSHFCRV